MCVLKIYIKGCENPGEEIDTIERSGKSACRKVALAHYTSCMYVWKWA